MKFFLQMGLLSGLLYTAAGCSCCADYCCDDYNSGCAATATGWQQNYNTVNTGGYQTTAQVDGTMSYQNVAGSQTNGYFHQSQTQMAQTPYYSSPYGNLCPCDVSGFSGTPMQDANGMPIEGMFYDPTVVPTPVDASASTGTNTNGSQVPKRQPVPQPQIGIPVGINGQPLVPPAPDE